MSIKNALEEVVKTCDSWDKALLGTVKGAVENVCTRETLEKKPMPEVVADIRSRIHTLRDQALQALHTLVNPHAEQLQKAQNGKAMLRLLTNDQDASAEHAPYYQEQVTLSIVAAQNKARLGYHTRAASAPAQTPPPQTPSWHGLLPQWLKNRLGLAAPPAAEATSAEVSKTPELGDIGSELAKLDNRLTRIRSIAKTLLQNGK